MKVIWAILCQSTVIDRYTNNVSLFNVIEEITIPSTPPQGASGRGGMGAGAAVVFQLVSLWVRSDLAVPERGYGRIRLATPDNQISTGQEFEVDLTQFLRLRQRTHMSTLPIRGEGIYRFMIDGRTDTQDWAEMFEVPLRVVIQAEGS